MFRKMTAFLAVAMIAISALASPNPKQVEDALSANNFTEAKQMVSQVLAEHPTSARAHLLNAYILAKVDHNKQAANNELRMVESLDKVGDVKNSPLFGRTVAAVEALPAPRAQAPVQQSTIQHIQSAPPVQEESSGHGFLLFLLAVLVIGIIILVIRRAMTASTVVVQSGSTGTSSQPVYSGSGGYAPSPVYNTGSGSSGLGTGMAVAGGVVAGSLIADSLLHRNNGGYNGGYNNGYAGNYNNGTTSRDYPTPPPADNTEGESTEVHRDSFNSGSSSNDTWEPSSSSSSSSDSSWGDSGSSSSSDSGGGDW